MRALALAIALILAGPAVSKELFAPSCAHTPSVSDPACDTAGKKKLPKPIAHNRHSVDGSPGLKIGHNVSIDAKTNFNENRFGQAPLEKFYPRPRGKDVSAGPQLDFKF